MQFTKLILSALLANTALSAPIRLLGREAEESEFATVVYPVVGLSGDSEQEYETAVMLKKRAYAYVTADAVTVYSTTTMKRDTLTTSSYYSTDISTVTADGTTYTVTITGNPPSTTSTSSSVPSSSSSNTSSSSSSTVTTTTTEEETETDTATDTAYLKTITTTVNNNVVTLLEKVYTSILAEDQTKVITYKYGSTVAVSDAPVVSTIISSVEGKSTILSSVPSLSSISSSSSVPSLSSSSSSSHLSSTSSSIVTSSPEPSSTVQSATETSSASFPSSSSTTRSSTTGTTTLANSSTKASSSSTTASPTVTALSSASSDQSNYTPYETDVLDGTCYVYYAEDDLTSSYSGDDEPYTTITITSVVATVTLSS